MYAGCPILWKSSMQKLVALSTTEAEYIALSSALREVIAIIDLLEELKGQGFGIHASTPNFKCKTFEDNKSCIEIATDHKTCPRTKHLSVRLHHFRSRIVRKQFPSNMSQLLKCLRTSSQNHSQLTSLRDSGTLPWVGQQVEYTTLIDHKGVYSTFCSTHDKVPMFIKLGSWEWFCEDVRKHFNN